MEEAQHYINLARQLNESGNYGNAFNSYIVALKKNPDIKDELEVEFRNTLSRHNEVLANASKMEDIFANFGKALDVYPTNANLVNDIGKYLYKFGFYTEAWAHFQRSLNLNSSSVNAEKNINSIKNLLLERWHFRMLNDKVRNEAYYNAISETVIRFKDSVLDIGTGTGILAMFATDCSATVVTGIEASENIAWLAECVTQGNNKHDIVIVNKMSTTLNYRDIGGKRSIIVTEMFDAGLLGEHVLQTLAHAWEYFAIPTSQIIPNKAEFFVIAAKSEYLNKKYHLSSEVKKWLEITLDAHLLTDDESYDCEDVDLLKDLKYMSEPQSLFKIDFNDYLDIQEMLSRSEPYSVQLTTTEDGEIHFFIGWFNLYLTKHITLTTDPRSKTKASAWQQAVFYDNIPKTVKKNSIIDLEFLINGGKLTMESDYTTPILRISQETMRFLNDMENVKMIAGCIGMASVYLGQMTEMTQTNIVDLSPFPIFGLLMLKRGIQSLFCYAKTDYDKKFFKEVFKAHNLPLSKIHILVGDGWGSEVFRHQRFHAVYYNILEICGDIDSRLRDILNDITHNHIFRGSLIIPAKINLMIQVINSNWLDVNNRVYDENVKNYKVAEYINKYEVTQNFNIDFSLLEYTAVTDALCMGSICSDTMLQVVTLPVIKDGPANAIMCWYSIEVMEGVEGLSTKRPGCFMDGTLYLIHPKTPLTAGNSLSILRCTDPDGSFKLMLGNEPTT
ncbi:unnamed protein product [Diatraea saccharalis]|uniref:Protein arginine N-methyltransferase domain-containing protein n=1 Tax=Diatraea saccharalis TaxID=40085 RepID=A0A9N9N1S6_9NEOP|nr:unnamed protein product [Diatraea saccharalis]